MKVVLHPADNHGCGSYRMIWPGETLAAQGHDVEVRLDATYPLVHTPGFLGGRPVPLGLCGDRREFHRIIACGRSELALATKRGADFAELMRINNRLLDETREFIARSGPPTLDADVYVFQRPLTRERFEFLQAIQQTGATVVVEVDDDFHAVHPRNVAWRDSNPLLNAEHNRDWLKKSCEIADLVTVTTPALAARYGGHGRVTVLPNYVPERYLTLAPPILDGERLFARHVTVGWAGSTDTHPGDLEVTKGAVARAVTNSAARFHVIGTGKGVQRALDLDEHPSSTGWLPLADYPEALAFLDIGIVPLKASQFNEAKSALKMMEYAATGSVPVGSPTTDNLRVRGLGVGEIAADEDAWYEAIRRLASDPVRRAEVAARSLEAMRELTIEKNAWRWLEAWAGARQLTAA